MCGGHRQMINIKEGSGENDPNFVSSQATATRPRLPWQPQMDTKPPARPDTLTLPWWVMFVFVHIYCIFCLLLWCNYLSLRVRLHLEVSDPSQNALKLLSGSSACRVPNLSGNLSWWSCDEGIDCSPFMGNYWLSKDSFHFLFFSFYYDSLKRCLYCV